MRIIHKSDVADKLRYFLTTHRKKRGSVQNFLELCSEFSQPIIFGGMLRDMILKGNSEFSSDVDIVLYGDKQNIFEDFMSQFSAKKNQFDGYRLHLDGWDIDIWLFQNTWAFRNDVVTGKDPIDLIKTTFFNWDSIGYLVNEKELFFSEDYFLNINNRFLDINLEKNPNIVGSLKRIIKFLISYNAKLSPRLCYYFCNNIEKLSFLRATGDSQDRILFELSLNLAKQIETHLKESSLIPFSIQSSIFERLPKPTGLNNF